MGETYFLDIRTYQAHLLLVFLNIETVNSGLRGAGVFDYVIADPPFGTGGLL